MKKLFSFILFAAMLSSSTRGDFFVSEAHPSGSGAQSTYGADWFELTNTGNSAIDITGWRVDDSSGLFSAGLVLRNVSSIAAGQSVVFIETNLSDSNFAEVSNNFRTAWFGGSVPSGFTIGSYGGSGIGLSTNGDAVNIYDSTEVLRASVSFGAATTGVTFDNAAGLAGAISQLSVSGINGAFASVPGEIGSPGSITAVPEPSSCLLLGSSVVIGALAQRRRRRK